MYQLLPENDKHPKQSLVDDSLSPSPSVLSVVNESEVSTSTLGESELNSPPLPTSRKDLKVTVSAAMMARIKMLEQENASLKCSLETFRLDHISHDERLVRSYTGFPSYAIFVAFFNFLGPAVNHLMYWGTKAGSHSRKKKLDPINGLFLTLIKLRLNLTEQDLAFRFGISTSTVSRYFITWICFLYNHLKEIEWCPSAEQVVASTLPHAFKQKYPTTYMIIDASELFVETPTDLMLQSSTYVE